MVRDLGKWRPGFYTEFRCASHEHSGLPWGIIFEENTKKTRNTHFLKVGMFQNSRNRHFSGTKAPQGATGHKGGVQNLEGSL